jgi:hypothetical protein
MVTIIAAMAGLDRSVIRESVIAGLQRPAARYQFGQAGRAQSHGSPGQNRKAERARPDVFANSILRTFRCGPKTLKKPVNKEPKRKPFRLVLFGWPIRVNRSAHTAAQILGAVKQVAEGGRGGAGDGSDPLL